MTVLSSLTVLLRYRRSHSVGIGDYIMTVMRSHIFLMREERVWS